MKMLSSMKTTSSGILTSVVIKKVIGEFALDPKGDHGTAHWMRVRANGLRLAMETGANTRVVEFFALFHDSKRQNEYRDPEHGKRGAENAQKYWRSGEFELSDSEFDLVYRACWGHTYEDIEDPCITIKTCWDADRLDLGRVGIVPDPQRLCTDAARKQEIRDWAYARSVKGLLSLN